MEKFDNEKFRNSIVSALIDDKLESYPEFTPEFIINKKGSKNVSIVIRDELKDCNEFLFSVAFITTSGISMLLKTLNDLKEKGIKGKIITADYLNFNSPEMFEKLMTIENVEVKISKDKNFHPKGYVFKKNDGTYTTIIGSSNLTEEALVSNVEWNVKIFFYKNASLLKKILNEFEEQWNGGRILSNDWIEEYRSIYYNSVNQLTTKEKQFINNYPNFSFKRFEPNRMQKEALLRLNELRKNNKNKALLISATGTGKTYLSAFDAKYFGAKKILFVAHRDVLLKNAYSSFLNVFDENEYTYGFLNKDFKSLNKDIIFATHQTLSKPEILNSIPKKYFDYIIFDEAHHSSSKSQKDILNYFKPKFLLGMTATPERNYGEEIYSLYDFNIAYEITLQKALEENLLCPFRYFGLNGSFIKNLEDDNVVDKILNLSNYYGCYNNKIKGLIFVSNLYEAWILTKKIRERNIPCAWVGTKKACDSRVEFSNWLEVDEGISNLESGKIKYLISVEKINEGVDIPCVNQIIMLRPTYSSIVFIQQLGRGLRKFNDGYQHKTYLTVLDFISNFNRDYNFQIPRALVGNKGIDKNSLKEIIFTFNYQNNLSTIEFDKVAERAIFESIENVGNRELKKSIIDEWKDISLKFKNNIVTHVEYFKNSTTSLEVFQSILKTTYLDFLISQGIIENDKFTSTELKYLRNVFNQFVFCKTTIFLDALTKLMNNKNEELDHYQIDELSKVHKKEINTKLPFLKKDGSTYDEFSKSLSNPTFVYWLKDLVEVGYLIYEAIYKPKEGFNFKLGLTYTRKDILKILKQNTFYSNTIIRAYKFFEEIETLPILVHYNKMPDVKEEVRYRDYFINQYRMHWESSNGKYINKGDFVKILDFMKMGGKVDLFVTNDSDNDYFYYVGKAVFDFDTIKEIKVNELGIEKTRVGVDLILDEPISDSLYNYFVK